MLTQIHFRGFHPVDEDETKRFAEALSSRLDRVVEFYREDQKRLRLVVEGTRQGYRVGGSMTVPNKALYAEGTGESLEGAMDLLFQRLHKEIVRHRGMVRKEYLKKRKYAWQEDLNNARSELAKQAKEEQREQFEDRFLPLLRNLYRTARRRIVLHQLAGELEPGELRPEEVLGELVGAEYESLHKASGTDDLVVALHQNLRDRIQTYVSSRKDQARPVADDGPDLSDARFVVAEDHAQVFYEPAEQLRWEDLVELHAEGYDVEAGDMHEQHSTQLIYRILSKLDGDRREPFVLHAIEGLDLPEVAKITRQSEKEVKGHVEEGERFLRHQLDLMRS